MASFSGIFDFLSRCPADIKHADRPAATFSRGETGGLAEAEQRAARRALSFVRTSGRFRGNLCGRGSVCTRVLREDSGVRHAEVARGVETHLSASRGSRARRFVVSRSKCGISRGRPWQISWPRTLYAAEVGDPPAGCGEPRVSPYVGFIQV